jgi:2-keto-4-pentenoate hydratase
VEPTDIKRAAQLLAEARSGELLDRLPQGQRPTSTAEAYAIQRAITAIVGEDIAGWKVGEVPGFGFCKGILLGSRIFAPGTNVPAGLMRAPGIEAEIAFRLDRSLPPRATPYLLEDVAAAVTALPAIEIVDTRFRDYNATPAIERAADFMANGGFVGGEPRSDWRRFDLSTLNVVLNINGREVVRRVGGHAAGNPIRPLVDFANDMRTGDGIPAGAVVTTGTYTGLTPAKAGDRVEVVFTGFGAVSIGLDA